MWPNPQKNADLVTLSEEILNEKLHFLCSDSESVYNKIFQKTKINFHGDEVTDFDYKEIPQVDSNHICLEVINLKSALKKYHNYYMQVLLKECKYIDKKLIRNINGNLK